MCGNLEQCIFLIVGLDSSVSQPSLQLQRLHEEVDRFVEIGSAQSRKLKLEVLKSETVCWCQFGDTK